MQVDNFKTIVDQCANQSNPTQVYCWSRFHKQMTVHCATTLLWVVARDLQHPVTLLYSDTSTLIGWKNWGDHANWG